MQIVELKVNVEKSQLEALAAEVEKLNGKVINFKTSTGGTGGASPTAGINKGLKETSQQAEKTGQSIMSVVGKVAKWTAVTTAVYAPVKAFKEALGTLKEVDSQLVQVQKVTNFSQRQMKEIEQQAYKTASAYGVSADKYTESVAAFARAGYKEQSAGLAELSTKTQLVGDTTAEVANQFLLSTDAAYKYNGSVQQLSRVLDGANELDNNYATSIEKIAEGMGLVAPVAAQAGIGVDELMASLGTITAVTQRSGAEAARAYRALVLNILGDTKTEIADGATWTAGEIEGLRDVLKTYAPEAVKAAEATGDIINPMKAMEGLSQAMKDGVLTEQKLMEMVSDIGGKLRTSQLLALIQNWDMYESMLSDFQNAAGSADKEVENAMNSWERKTEVLKNTWTEFVSHMVDTDLIKGGLDAVTGFVEVLDSGFGQAAIKAGAFALAMNGITKGLMALAGTTVVRDLGAFISLLSTEGVAAFGALSATITPLMAIAALSADFMFMKKAIDEAYVSMDEQEAIVEDLKSQYEQLTGAGSEYAQLMDKVGTGDLTQRDRARLTVLNAQADALERQIKLEEERQFQMFQQQESGRYQRENGQMVDTGVGKTGDVKRLQEMNKLYEEGYEKVKKGESSLEDYRGVLQDIIADNSDWYEQMKEWEDLGFGDSFTDAQKEAMALYETIAQLLNLGDEDLPIVKALDGFEEAGRGVAEFANQAVVDAAQLRQAFADAGLGVEEANAAIEALRADGTIVIDVENDGLDETLGYLEELGVAIKDGNNWKIDVDGLANLADDLGMSSEQAAALSQALQKAGNVSMDGTVDSVSNIATSVSDLINGSPFSFDLNATDNASGPIQTAEGEAEEFANGDYNAKINATDNASSVINPARALATGYQNTYIATLKAIDNASSVIRGAVSALAGFVSKTIHLTTVHNNVYTGAASSDLKHATGALNFRGGPTLLGDELSPDGSPRPELVITKNGAFIAGITGPVMTSLPAGSRIFKYSDTMDILSGGDISQLQAFAGGGGGSLADRYLRGKNRVATGTQVGSSSGSASKPSTSSSSSRSSSSSGSRSSGPSRSGGRSGGSSGSSGGGGSSVDTLKEELELLEAQYSYLEASNASTEELHNKSKEIQAKLHQINDTLRSTGGKEKDIVDNSTKWWQETEKQRQLLEEDVSLLEAQYDFMEESGASAEDLNAKSAEIQAKLHEINELARATGASEEDILKTSQKWWQELKKIHEVQRDVYQNERNLLQSEADLMEHQNKSASERIAKLRQIQESLHREAEYMRSIKASQAEINQLSIQWWEIESNIRAIQQDLVDQLNSAMSSAIDRASDRKDDAISELNDQIKELERERKARIESELGEKKAWIEVEEAAIKAIRREQEIAKENQAIADAEADIQEKKVKLLEAEKNLRNAMRQRTVRYYNAKTGQWEWGADARNVKQAQEEYDRAKKDAEDAEANLPKLIEDTELSRRERILNETKDSVQDIEDKINDEFDALIDAVEDEIDALNTGFDDLESEWDKLFQSIFGDSVTNIENILQQMLDTGVITEEQANEIRAFWEKINGFAASIDDTTKKILRTIESFSEFKQENPQGSFADYVEESGIQADPGKFSPALVDWIENHPDAQWTLTGEDGTQLNSEGEIYVAPDGANENAIRLSGGTEQAKAHAVYSGKQSGHSIDEMGTDNSGGGLTGEAFRNWISSSSSSSSSSSTSSSSSSSSSKSNVISQMQSNSAAWHNASASEKQRLADENKKLGESQGWSRGDNGAWYDKNGKRVYDSGGILSGFGGIKATARDEIVIPPDLAEYMLKPSANKMFQSRVSELAYLYGAKPIPGALSNNRSSNDHYGDTYTFGNVTLTEDKARTTTVYELAQMSRSLGIYRNG